MAAFEHYLPQKWAKPAKIMLKIANILMKAHKNFGILQFEVKVVDTFIGTKNCKLQKRLTAS